MAIQTKICGLTTAEAVGAAVEAGADYLGFVFYPRSPRNVSAQAMASLVAAVPDTVKTVAVVVDATDAMLDDIVFTAKPDFIQCHGQESPARVKEIDAKYAVPVIKAIAVRSADDVQAGQDYTDVAQMLLFDAKASEDGLPGGNGVAFDWTLLKRDSFDVPWFLSGGITIENIVDAVTITDANYVDVSSSLESKPGVKDPELVTLFLEKVRSL